MPIALAMTLAGLALAGTAPAVAGSNHFACNDTAVTSFSGVYFAPAGTTARAPDQALNANDKALDFAARLTLTGLDSGPYDVQLIDKKGRACIMHKVDLTKTACFDIRDPDLARCQ